MRKKEVDDKRRRGGEEDYRKELEWPHCRTSKLAALVFPATLQS